MLFAPIKCILLFDSTSQVDASAILESRRAVLQKIGKADQSRYAVTYFDETMEATTFLSTRPVVPNRDHDCA
jgi:hypothetical protein